MNNNDIFKKLRVALQLRDDQIIEIVNLVNFRISKIVVIHGFEYSNEELLEIDGVRYQVISSYKISSEELELKLKSKKGGA